MSEIQAISARLRGTLDDHYFEVGETMVKKTDLKTLLDYVDRGLYEYAVQFYDPDTEATAGIPESGWMDHDTAREEVDSYTFIRETTVRVRLVRRIKGTREVEIFE